jgi:hypothetical protein
LDIVITNNGTNTKLPVTTNLFHRVRVGLIII